MFIDIIIVKKKVSKFIIQIEKNRHVITIYANNKWLG
jgi:hypothetical protein